MSVIQNVCRAGPYRLALAAEATAWLLLLRLSIGAIPFRYIAFFLGECVSPSDIRVRQLLDNRLDDVDLCRARAVSWAIACAARHIPAVTACLHHAIAARMMLRCRSVSTVMHLGACKENSSPAFAAHAWLVAPGLEVMGYPAARRFAPIASFL